MIDLAVSRRAVTCALAMLPAIAIPSIAAANPCGGPKGDDPMNMHSTAFATDRAGGGGSVDPDFWALHRQWRGLIEQWESDDREDEDVWDYYSAATLDLEARLTDAPITSVAALVAKFDLIKDRNGMPWSDGVTLHERVMWDAERLIKREMFGEAAFRT
jgi:hypothetical protein